MLTPGSGAGVAPLSMLVAATTDDLIGINNELPWYLPEDLKRFRLLTTGCAVIMGRATFESIVARIGKPLPERYSVVVSSTLDSQALPEESGIVVRSVESAIEVARDWADRTKSTPWVIGGASIYAAAMAQIDAIELTRVLADFDGDAHLPTGWLQGFVRVSHSQPQVSSVDDLPYVYERYERAEPQ